MFDQLERINQRPKSYEFCTATDLWTDEYVSKQMLKFHLDPSAEAASRTFEFIDKSATWIGERFSIGNNTRVIDFGCGPGLYTSRFAKLGAKVTGLDFSAGSIEHAKNTAKEDGLDIEYALGDYLDYIPTGKFDLITFIYWDLAPLSPDQRTRLYGIFRECLADGGVLLLDLPSLKFFEQAEEKRTYEYSPGGSFWSADPHYIFQNTILYPDEKVYLDKYTIYESSRKREIYNWLQAFSPESLATEFEANGLRVLEKYGDVAGAPYDPEAAQFAVVAQKRS
jgi:SAM-dependent methyltransferase